MSESMASLPPTESADKSDAGQSHRWRFQYSLSSLLLFILFVALILTSVLMYRRISKAEKELEAVRKGAGYMVIEDENIFQAVAIETYEPLTWRWRIYLPKGHKYSWKAAYGDIPNKSTVSESGIGTGDVGCTGEIILNVALRENKDDKWLLYLTFRPNIYGENSHAYAQATNGVSISDSVAKEMLQQPTGFQYMIMAMNGAETRRPDEQIILLKYRMAEKNSSGGFHSTDQPTPGIMVWLEEAK